MLRAGQRALAVLQSSSAETCLRCFAAQSWPAEVPVPAGVKPFDPAGPLAPQVDALSEGLPENDAFVKFVNDLKDLRVAVDKINMENAHVRPTIGLPTLRLPAAQRCCLQTCAVVMTA